MKGRIVIAGGSGIIGTACRTFFMGEGYEVVILTRRKTTGNGEISWRPGEKWISGNIIDGSLAVINLCGVSLAEKRWTRKYKQELLQSRVVPALYLKSLIDASAVPPACYIGISGIGIYGDQGDRPIHDDCRLIAKGFVPGLVEHWERAHLAVDRVRNIRMRTGVVITRHGGFLEKLLLPARFGLYPYFGNGKQLLSWIYIGDLVRMFLYCIQTSAISGVYHATALRGIAQRELVNCLKKARNKPGIEFGIPEIFLRIGLGEMASILFESADVRPDKIVQAGFQHQYTDITSALQAALD